jgi:hypothetical protein
MIYLKFGHTEPTFLWKKYVFHKKTLKFLFDENCNFQYTYISVEQ